MHLFSHSQRVSHATKACLKDNLFLNLVFSCRQTRITFPESWFFHCIQWIVLCRVIFNNYNSPFLYSTYLSMRYHPKRSNYYPGFSPCSTGAEAFQGINSYQIVRYPFATPGSRETILDKMPCLCAYTHWVELNPGPSD